MIKIAMSDVPRAHIINALRPDEDPLGSDQLRYSNLKPAIEKQARHEFVRLNKVWETDDPLQEEDAARQAANQYLLKTALQLQEAGETQAPVLSERFTQASIELFGAPEPGVVQELLTSQHAELNEGKGSIDPALYDYLNRMYEEFLGQTTPGELQKSEEHARHVHVAAEAIRHVMESRFEGALSAFAGPDEEGVSMEEFADCFERGLVSLGSIDAAWENWKINRSEDGKRVVAKTSKEQIEIGMARVPSTRKEARGLFAHEVLGHCLSKINADKLGIKTALPGYTDGEEGKCTFFEYAITGEVPQKNIDRYVDVSLALGQLNGSPMPRKELYDFVLARFIAREQAAGRKFDQNELEVKSREHVNRIYRGSRGDHHVGVFTKDSAYYKGFELVANMVVEQLRKGVDPAEIFDFLVSGKFDPTNPLHVEHIAGLRANATINHND